MIAEVPILSLHPLSTTSGLEAGAAWQRILGGAGLLVAIVVLLAIPVFLAWRGGRARRRRACRSGRTTQVPDAWRLAGQRLGERP
ncbi:MAG: hypothetical protein RLZZ558_1453 [Planctomycetota bacterium]|jgi:hypothetical protein